MPIVVGGATETRRGAKAAGGLGANRCPCGASRGTDVVRHAADCGAVSYVLS